MAEVACRPTLPFEAGSYNMPNTSRCSNTAIPHCNVLLQAQPDFSFPSRSSTPNLNNEMQSPTESIFSNGPTRTHTRAINSMSALPAFTFNPSATLSSSDATTTAQPPSTVSAPTTPIRGGRHRRTASELIGGSSDFPAFPGGHSPTKAWMQYSLPSAAPAFGSLPSRLETRHRRSDTMSSQEIAIDTAHAAFEADALATTSFSETPTSSEPPQMDSSARVSTSALSRPHFDRPRQRGSASKSPPLRHRVGFSENVEFIPRPLSTISSESGSSMSTVRAHSTSASISSVMASGASSPLGKAMHNPLHKSFDSASSPLKAYMGSLDPQAATTSAPTDNLANDPSPLASPAITPEIDATPTLGPQGLSCTTIPISSDSMMPMNDNRKPRRVPHWTTLLGRKAKPSEVDLRSFGNSDDAVRPNSAVTAVTALDTQPVELSEDFDADPTSIIIADFQPFDATATNTPPLTPSDRSLGDDYTSATQSSAIIDLDALMAADGVQDPRFPKIRAFNGTRRSIHSSTTGNGLFAFATHRRADSAPSVMPNTFDSASFRERNSSLSSFKPYKMEDVFEEEEDVTQAQNIAARAGKTMSTASNDDIPTSSGTTLSENPADADNTIVPPANAPRRLRFVAPPPNFTAPPPFDTLHPNRYDHLDTHDYRRPSSDTGYLSLSDQQSLKHARSMETESFPLRNRFHGSNELRSGSPLSSGCGCGKDCSDTRRRDTALSFSSDSRRAYAQSLADRGSEVRYSVDDVPSLISSRSTLTNAAHPRPPSTSSRGVAPRSTGSSFSLSGGASGERGRQRSSIASFTRFVGSNFGERSNQPSEPGMRWRNPIEAKDIKSPKSSRFGRLLRFWKPKPTSTS